jgi:hypothetical protein
MIIRYFFNGNSPRNWLIVAFCFIWVLIGVFIARAQTVGPELDGISYQVLSSSEVVKPSVQCGFNDLSFPNPAKFRREVRQFAERREGKVVRTWTETEDVFVDCMPL